MPRYKLDEAKLRRQMVKLGFVTMSQFASKHGINRATLNNYLQGRGPFPESFYTIADALHADPIQLLAPVASLGDIFKLTEILQIITACANVSPDIAVGLFGSRARGNAKTYSDWDIGVTAGSQKLSVKEFLQLKQIVEDLKEDLPREVDVINLDVAPDWFLKGINYTPRFLGGNETSWAYFMGVMHGFQKNAGQAA